MKNVSANSLARPSSEHRDGREIIFNWEIGNQEGACHLTTLTVSYHPAGLDVEVGERLPSRYDATLTTQTEPPFPNGAVVYEIPFTGLLVHRGATPGFSRSGIEAFAEEALSRLSDLYASDDPSLVPYFRP